MAKKKKIVKNEAQNELKTLESKWLKDRRMNELEPVQVKVMAAKVAALVEFAEQNEMHINLGDWPLAGAEELIKMEESAFKQGLANLQKVGILNSSLKIRKVTSEQVPIENAMKSENGMLTFMCVKPGGVNITDRDEYILEDHEVSYTEEGISSSPNLQYAIANEWLVRVNVSSRGA